MRRGQPPTRPIAPPITSTPADPIVRLKNDANDALRRGDHDRRAFASGPGASAALDRFARKTTTSAAVRLAIIRLAIVRLAIVRLAIVRSRGRRRTATGPRRVPASRVCELVGARA